MPAAPSGNSDLSRHGAAQQMGLPQDDSLGNSNGSGNLGRAGVSREDRRKQHAAHTEWPRRFSSSLRLGACGENLQMAARSTPWRGHRAVVRAWGLQAVNVTRLYASTSVPLSAAGTGHQTTRISSW